MSPIAEGKGTFRVEDDDEQEEEEEEEEGAVPE